MRYGFDAPGIMIGLLAAGSVGLGGGIALADGLGWTGLGASLAVLGVVPALLGISMVAYGLVGKARIREAILNRFSWRGDEHVLDIGTGRGLLLIGAAKRLGAGGQAAGVDIFRSEDLSNNSMDALQANIAAEGVTGRATAKHGDARDLPFPESCFDVVLSLYCIHNIEPQADQDRALAEAYRVLKPGGRMILGEWLPTYRYARVLASQGAVGLSTFTAFSTALAPMWLTEARKPA